MITSTWEPGNHAVENAPFLFWRNRAKEQNPFLLLARGWRGSRTLKKSDITFFFTCTFSPSRTHFWKFFEKFMGFELDEEGIFVIEERWHNMLAQQHFKWHNLVIPRLYADQSDTKTRLRLFYILQQCVCIYKTISLSAACHFNERSKLDLKGQQFVIFVKIMRTIFRSASLACFL